MAVLDTKTKRKFGFKALKAMARHPRATRKTVQVVGPPVVKVAKPIAKRRVQQRTQAIGETVRLITEAIATYAPDTARDLGLAEAPGVTSAPTRKRTASRVAVGVVIGASAMYFLEPGSGRAHREKVAGLVA